MTQLKCRSLSYYPERYILLLNPSAKYQNSSTNNQPLLFHNLDSGNQRRHFRIITFIVIEP
jgi:hypothetical protein